MTQTGRYHGGLVFFGCEDALLDRFSRIATATLEDYAHPVERQSMMNAHEARITASHYQVRLCLSQGPVPSDQALRSRRLDAAGGLNPGWPVVNGATEHRLRIELCPVDPGHDDRNLSELLLVVMLYRMVDALEAVQVEWLDPDTVLSTDQFLSAFNDISPARVRGRQEIIGRGAARFAPVDDTAETLSMQFETVTGRKPHAGQTGLVELTAEEALALAFRTEPHPDELSPEELAQNDIRRLATWAMTGVVGFMSAPVAIPLAAVNLIRGEDFRLNTHVLSLTGFLMMLQSSGALASAVSYLPL